MNDSRQDSEDENCDRNIESSGQDQEVQLRKNDSTGKMMKQNF